MSRRRILNPDEELLWQAVARTAQPMHKALRRKVEAAFAPASPPTASPENLRLPNFRIGEKSRPLIPAASLPTALTLAMDAKAYARLNKGKLAPEARIDLHGLTLSEAHPELIRFLLNAHSAGLRLVLVITGKGKPTQDHGPIPARLGVLRHHVPLWLRQPPLAPAILQVVEAHLKHGGSGALYVYLRRR